MAPHIAAQCVLPTRPATKAVASAISDIAATLGVAGTAVVVEEDLHGGRVEIVELSGTHGPEEGPHGHTEQHEAEGNEQVEDAHARLACASLSVVCATWGADGVRMRRMAFRTTRSELVDMPIAATHGVS